MGSWWQCLNIMWLCFKDSWRIRKEYIIKFTFNYCPGLPWWLSGKECSCQYRRHGFDPWSVKIPCRRKWQPTPVFLPGKPQGLRSLADYSPWIAKSWTQPSDSTTTTTGPLLKLLFYFCGIILFSGTLKDQRSCVKVRVGGSLSNETVRGGIWFLRGEINPQTGRCKVWPYEV